MRHAVRMARRTNLLLPDELVREVDRVAGPRGRSRYVAEAVERQLRRDRLREAFESTFGALNPDDHPEWSTREKVDEWVRQRRAEETDPGPPDDGPDRR
jgi:predicted transcriptional regulator